MNAYKNASFAGIIIAIFGIIISIYGFSFLLAEKDLDENGIITTGTVIEINEKDFYRSPFVEFTTQDGQQIIFLSKLDVNVDMFQYEVGQQVEVIYHKDDPHNAEINAFWERNTAQMYLGILGTILIVFGVLWRRYLLKKAEKYEDQIRQQ